MKKTLAMVLAMGMTIASLTACGGSKPAETTAAATGAQTEAASSAADTKTEITEPAGGKAEGPITVVSREDGSGTRGAFIELFGIESKNDAGEKVDNTTEDAEITNSTSVMMTTIAGNKGAIGYVSLGSLNDTVKAVDIDSAEASVDAIKAGEYKVARPFNIAVKDDLSDVASDFITFIMSEDGQKVVEDNGYISQGNEGAYTATGLKGKVVVAGSSSVTPVMEKLIEAYKSVNPNASIDLQTSDSTSGMTGAMDGTFAIGMASRELKDEEAAQLTGTAIALDGIAVIVNPANTIDELSMDQIKSIYVGDITDWGDLA